MARLRRSHRVLLALSVALVALVAPFTTPATGKSLGSDSAPTIREASAPAPGDELWVQRYNGTGNGDDRAEAIDVSPDGTKVFVTGASPGSTSSSDYATIAYDASTGAEVWERRYNGPGNGFDWAHDVHASPDGTKVIVTGASTGSTGSTDFATIAYEASTGATVWVRRAGDPGSGDDTAYALDVSPDGSRVFVTGTGGAHFFGESRITTVAYDAAIGARLWVRSQDSPGESADEGRDLDVSPDGTTVFVVGERYWFDDTADYVTIAYDAATGAVVWRRSFDSPGWSSDSPEALGVSPDGTRVFVTGYSYRQPEDTEVWDYVTIAYDASTGAGLWRKRYATPGDFAWAWDIAVSRDCTRVFVTGQSDSGTTIAYDASTGATLWVGASTATGRALGVSPDGAAVFVTGYGSGTDGVDYVTIAHDVSEGAELWAQSFSSPGSYMDQAYALAVSPDGARVFVTGNGGFDGVLDYTTIAYAAG